MTATKPTDTHVQYDAMRTTWKLCRDVVVGQRAVHKAGRAYLPELGGQTQAEYDAYKMRALFMNATGRTVEGLVGLVFRKDPVLGKLFTQAPFKDYAQDIDMAGTSLAGFAQKCVTDAIVVARCGVLVDHPAPPAPPKKGAKITIEQSRSLGMRPYLTHYRAEDILNWRFARIDNQVRLSQVFLQEEDETDTKGTKKQIRELSLDGGVYVQRIWRQGSGRKVGWVASPDIVPKMDGKPITVIPFWLIQPMEGRGDVQDPPIEDLAHVNIAHYRNSADLENGAHVAGLPTPWVSGVTDTKNFPVLHLGSGSFLTLPPNASAGFLQCGGEGFATIENAMDRKEQSMAALGARMLAPEKREAEAADTMAHKRSGENSVLAACAGSCSRSLTQALQFMALWAGADPKDATIELNKDYFDVQLTAEQINALVASWQKGAISKKTMFHNFKQGELVPENVSFEEEEERIASAAPQVIDDADDQ